MPILNKALKRRILKHQYTMDKQCSKIKRMKELPNLWYGEVKSVEETSHLAFIVRNGKIEISDLLPLKESKFTFTYCLHTRSMNGKGTVNFYRTCEKYVAYVLFLLDELEAQES